MSQPHCPLKSLSVPLIDYSLDIFFPQDFATVSIGVRGIFEGSGDHWFMPMSRSLSTKTGDWSRSARSKACQPNSKHSFDAAGKQDHLLRVAVTDEADKGQVALRGARGQSGGGPDALHVPDDERHLGVVGQACEFGHQADAQVRRWRSSNASRSTRRRWPCRWRPVRLRPEPPRRCACHLSGLRSCGRYSFSASASEEAGVIGYQAANWSHRRSSRWRPRYCRRP